MLALSRGISVEVGGCLSRTGKYLSLKLIACAIVRLSDELFSLLIVPMLAATASKPTERLFERVKAIPAYRMISGVVEQRIVHGELAPGTLLPTEAELADQFGVNRSTVREAIRQLEQEGLVERRSSKRLQVTMPGIYDAAPRAARSLLLQQVTFSELWQVAVVLEPQAARLAALSASNEDIEQLAANVERLSLHHKNGGSMQEHAQIDIEFHATVARASGNRVLMLAREPINLLYRPSLTRLQAVLPQMERRNLDAHKRIFKAIAGHDAEQAQEWTRKHLIDFQRGYTLARIPMNTPIETNHPE